MVYDNFSRTYSSRRKRYTCHGISHFIFICMHCELWRSMRSSNSVHAEEEVKNDDRFSYVIRPSMLELLSSFHTASPEIAEENDLTSYDDTRKPRCTFKLRCTGRVGRLVANMDNFSEGREDRFTFITQNYPLR